MKNASRVSLVELIRELNCKMVNNNKLRHLRTHTPKGER